MNAEVALHSKLNEERSWKKRGQNLELGYAAADCGPCVFDESDPVSLGNPRSVLTLHLAPDRLEKEEADGALFFFSFPFLLGHHFLRSVLLSISPPPLNLVFSKNLLFIFLLVTPLRLRVRSVADVWRKRRKRVCAPICGINLSSETL